MLGRTHARSDVVWQLPVSSRVEHDAMPTIRRATRRGSGVGIRHATNDPSRAERPVDSAAGGAGNRNDPIHYRGTHVEAQCRAHARVLADTRCRGVPELITPVFRKHRIIRDRAWRSHRKRRVRVE